MARLGLVLLLLAAAAAPLSFEIHVVVAVLLTAAAIVVRPFSLEELARMDFGEPLAQGVMEWTPGQEKRCGPGR